MSSLQKTTSIYRKRSPDNKEKKDRNVQKAKSVWFSNTSIVHQENAKGISKKVTIKTDTGSPVQISNRLKVIQNNEGKDEGNDEGNEYFEGNNENNEYNEGNIESNEQSEQNESNDCENFSIRKPQKIESEFDRPTNKSLFKKETYKTKKSSKGNSGNSNSMKRGNTYKEYFNNPLFEHSSSNFMERNVPSFHKAKTIDFSNLFKNSSM